MPDAAATERYFLSYSRSDERVALRLARDLRTRGVAMWVDQLDIRPSEHWDRAIERAVRDCRGLVVILSPRSVASDNVADEISYAMEHRKSVLPVLIEKCSLPLRITRMHMIDATQVYDRAVEQCVAELKRAETALYPTAGQAEPSPIDPAAIATAKRQLTSIVGPIAVIVVDKAASRASTVNELNSLLMQHVEDPADRARFARLTAPSDVIPADMKVSPPTAMRSEDGAIAHADVERLAKALTKYLGPIATILARRESRGTASVADLQLRLAALISDEPDRADFLKRSQLPQGRA